MQEKRRHSTIAGKLVGILFRQKSIVPVLANRKSRAGARNVRQHIPHGMCWRTFYDLHAPASVTSYKGGRHCLRHLPVLLHQQPEVFQRLLLPVLFSCTGSCLWLRPAPEHRSKCATAAALPTAAWMDGVLCIGSHPLVVFCASTTASISLALPEAAIRDMQATPVTRLFAVNLTGVRNREKGAGALPCRAERINTNVPSGMCRRAQRFSRASLS